MNCNPKKHCLRIALILAVICLNSVSLYSQIPAAHVTFVLHSPDLPQDTAVYITGGLDQLANWNPGKIRMDSVGNHTWSKQILINQPLPLSIEYKYTLGSWEREGADATGSPLKNFVADINQDKTVNDTILFWTRAARQKTVTGQITGTVKYHRGLQGDGVKPRDLIVWLPPGYEKNTMARYPVLYMQDGQNIFDPVTSSFGADWSIDETADRLIRDKTIPPLIVVGIYNTPDRMREYTPGETGAAYMKFVVNKVKPLIDSTYRTVSDREHTMVGGSSAGGTISFMLLWEHPDIFSKAICMSPAFKSPGTLPSSWDYVSQVRNERKREHVFVYIDNGGVGLDSQLQPGVDAMLETLKSAGYKEGQDFVFIKAPEAKHFEADWAKRFPDALKLTLKH